MTSIAEKIPGPVTPRSSRLGFTTRISDANPTIQDKLSFPTPIDTRMDASSIHPVLRGARIRPRTVTVVTLAGAFSSGDHGGLSKAAPGRREKGAIL